MVEPVNDIADSEQRLDKPAPPPPPDPLRVPHKDDTEPCRPHVRPPLPVLCVFDDGRRTGETVRLRKTPLVIGRTQGNVRILHDELIADPHAEIAWRGRKLMLRDLKTESGMFIRVNKARLTAGQQVRLGMGLFQFEEPGQLVAGDGGTRRRYRPKGNEMWIGRDPGPEGLRLPDDRALNTRHARLARDDSGHWLLVDNKSHNGVWIRMDEVEVQSVVEFMLGEQRFRLELNPKGE